MDNWRNPYEDDDGHEPEGYEEYRPGLPEDDEPPRRNGWGTAIRIAVGAFAALSLVVATVMAGGIGPFRLFGDTAPVAPNLRPAAYHVNTSAFRQVPTVTAVAPVVVAEANAMQDVLINVFLRLEASIVNIEVASGTGRESLDSSGSGFVYDNQGHIVTNAHVVQDAESIWVTFRDGHVATARIVGADDYSDLAVIRVNTDPERLIAARLGDSDSLQVGQAVIAIGNPFGLRSSMTTGIISALGRALSSQRMLRGLSDANLFQNPSIIQIDASINPGNSGGPLLDLTGTVIGVNTAIRSETGGFQGVGFAVPVNTVRRVVPQLIANGRAQYTWLGISSISAQTSGISSVTVAALADEYGLPVDYGVLVTEVFPNSPAAAAGLQGGTRRIAVRGIEVQLGGDIIIAINGQPLRDFDSLMAYLVANTSPGDVATLTIYRGDRVFDLDVRLMLRP